MAGMAAEDKSFQQVIYSLSIKNSKGFFSASGLGSAFDFSTSAHVIIQMMGKDRAKVEMYPTFSIKVGCAFDFTDYPYDLNKCAINLFSTSTMADVQLQNLYAIPPTLSFGS